MTAIAQPFAPARPRPTTRRRIGALVDRWGLAAYTIAAVAIYARLLGTEQLTG